MTVLHLALCCLLIIAKEAKEFEQCEMYYKLRHLGLDGFLGNGLNRYLCVTMHPAAFRTQHYVNEGGVPRYGVFWLSGLEWCDNGRHPTQNKCNTSCDNFLNDDINDDVRCFKKAVSQHGLNHWRHYKEKCKPALLKFLFTYCSYFFQYEAWYRKIIDSMTPKKKFSVHVHFQKN